MSRMTSIVITIGIKIELFVIFYFTFYCDLVYSRLFNLSRLHSYGGLHLLLWRCNANGIDNSYNIAAFERIYCSLYIIKCALKNFRLV